MIKLVWGLAVIFVVACSQITTSEKSDVERLQKAGITKIKFQTEPLKNLKCGDGVETKYFTGETKLGQSIGGVLCKGKLKQTTLRF